MDTILKNKKAIIALALLLIAFYVLSLVFGGRPDTAENATENNAALVEIAGELSNIEFKQELFTKPAYKQLVDFTATLPTDAPGRPNPFDVIGR